MTTSKDGGDPPCWAHLFDDDAADQAVGRLARIAGSDEAHGLAWNTQSEDLNLNLLVFRTGEGIGEHQNPEVDVLLVGIAGEGIVFIDGHAHGLRTGDTIVIPKGARRSTQATGERFSYLTCHRRRGGLLPGVRPKPALGVE